MAFCRAATLCVLLVSVIQISQSLMLDRLPRHVPLTKSGLSDSLEDDDIADSFDPSVEKMKLVPYHKEKDPWRKSSLENQLILQNRISKIPTNFGKRSVNENVDDISTSEKDREELANILKDEDDDDLKPEKKASVKKTISRHLKTKRQSIDESELKEPDEKESEDKEEVTKHSESFQEWLRKEYYRNMAKSFATMRRKRDDSGRYPRALPIKRQKKSVQPSTSITDITDNLRNIEDQLFQDALQVLRDSGDEYSDDVQRQNRITNDLNLAYDLETMRNAFFRLKETLSNIENEDTNDDDVYRVARKRSSECPPLDQLTSDCAALSDIMPDGSLKRLLRRACNWHEVCYTCGKAYGLTSESCDGSFIEQTQTICRGDAPCESTASLLVVPLRQRRVFYKRSNPEICIEEPCVEAYLKEGLAAMEQGLYSIRNNLNAMRHA